MPLQVGEEPTVRATLLAPTQASCLCEHTRKEAFKEQDPNGIHTTQLQSGGFGSNLDYCLLGLELRQISMSVYLLQFP